ncbi:MAG: MBOAT family protein [Clostridia bacterium]|nr:MBOAT family protein [Clostridia bacterium]
MVFSSAVFLFVFFPLMLVLYYLPGFSKDPQKDMAKKNLVLCLASLIFYAWGEPVYIVLMLISIFFNYNLGIDIENHKNSRKKRKNLLIFGVIFNLFMLGFFKYSGFIVENINAVTGNKIEYEGLPLPVGISFYTFQILSYVIDVYKGEVKAQKNLVAFGAYISMFPQLIAGPIVQYSDIERQLTSRTVTIEKFYDGIIYFIRGLGKKVLFANTIGSVYSQVIAEDISSLSVLSSWIAVICYTLQIYFDFSGYSDMAVGLGKMFGFEFVQNFNFPYKATSIKDFWSRWHISLSSWFRDYVYIPLGGNRKGTKRTIINTFIVWSLTGLWHGAAWNFIAWGMFYGVLLILEKYVLKDFLQKLPYAAKYIGTMIVVMIGWVFFSSANLGDAMTLIGSMVGFGGSFIDAQAKYLFSENIFLILVMSLSATGVFETAGNLLHGTKKKICYSVGYIAVFALCIAYLISETYNPFLYFRF